MFIFIGCAGGGTSSMFCQRIVQEINTTDENLSAVFDSVEAVLKKQRALGGAYDLIFAYGGLDVIRGSNAFEFGKLFDVILVAPQVRYLMASKQRLLQNYPTIVKDLPPQLFGRMDAKSGYQEILAELITLDDERAYLSSILDTTKRADKNPELLWLAGDQKHPLVTQLLDHWQDKLNLRVLQQSFNVELLYDFVPEKDFDLRLLYCPAIALDEESLPKIARRIDGLIVAPGARARVKELAKWLKAYDIPYYQLTYQMYDDLLQVEDLNNLDDFLLAVAQHTEFASDHAVTALETATLKPRKSILFGLISWG